MATNPVHSEESWNWPKRGDAMSEEEYHKLERLDPEHKYEYIAGMAYMMSGGSVGHDRIARRITPLFEDRLAGLCTAFGSDVRVLIGAKKVVRDISCTLIQPFRVHQWMDAQIICLSNHPNCD